MCAIVIIGVRKYGLVGACGLVLVRRVRLMRRAREAAAGPDPVVVCSWCQWW